jgi:D-tyrosyl-tRNA(Tyr) deacylase
MRAVVQRVSSASVSVDDDVVGSIERGFLVLLGVGGEDDATDITYLADKIANLRIFPDDEGRMNLSLLDIGGTALVVSQFTLYGDCRRGRRPSFTKAAPPDRADALYTEFVAALSERGVPVQTGVFRATMDVQLVNDGPVTILLDSKRLF